MHDSDDLRTVNLVRHALSDGVVGYPKPFGLAVRLSGTAPWCNVETAPDLPYDPHVLADQISGHDLVIDCTGTLPLTRALAHVASSGNVPLLTGALHHHGSVVRIRRQALGDTLLGQRRSDPRYVQLPLALPEATIADRFLEIGCTAPINSAPPASVIRAAADIAAAAVDLLTGRRLFPDETITVLSPLASAPFNVRGPVFPPS